MADIWTQLARYRQVKVLPDGLRVLLRPMCEQDAEQLIDMFSRATPQDVERFRSGRIDRGVVEGWIRDLDLSKVFPVLAVVNGRVIGDASIHFGAKFQRHLGWVRIFLDREFRHRGIGTLMIGAMIEIARRVGLHQLIALVPADQPQVVRAFQNLGFKSEFVHRDYAMLQGGSTLDVVELVLHLIDHSGEF
jgi:RimJ/RimL family protein N-acetyltransferase